MVQNYMRRLFWLILGVAVSSVGIAMMLQANVGLEPWSVLQQGMSLRTGMTYGTASAIAGAAAILTAVLFGESFGLGTIINIAGCAVIIDAIQAAHLIPQMARIGERHCHAHRRSGAACARHLAVHEKRARQRPPRRADGRARA